MSLDILKLNTYNITMTNLADKKCIPCEGGIPAFDLKEIHKYLKKVDGWDVLKNLSLIHI